MRERNCTNPAPSCGGDDCVVEYKVDSLGVNNTVGTNETDPCNQGIKCPGTYFPTLNIRDVIFFFILLFRSQLYLNFYIIQFLEIGANGEIGQPVV